MTAKKKTKAKKPAATEKKAAKPKASAAGKATPAPVAKAKARKPKSVGSATLDAILGIAPTSKKKGTLPTARTSNPSGASITIH